MRQLACHEFAAWKEKWAYHGQQVLQKARALRSGCRKKRRDIGSWPGARVPIDCLIFVSVRQKRDTLGMFIVIYVGMST